MSESNFNHIRQLCIFNLFHSFVHMIAYTAATQLRLHFDYFPEAELAVLAEVKTIMDSVDKELSGQETELNAFLK